MMRFHKNTAIHCPKYTDAKELLEKLEESGYGWASGDPLSYMNYVDFYAYGIDTYIFIEGRDVSYGTCRNIDGHETFEFSNGVLTRNDINVYLNEKHKKALQYALDIVNEYVSSAGYDEKAIEVEDTLAELLNAFNCKCD